MGNKSVQYEKIQQEFDAICDWYAEQQWRQIQDIILKNPKETYYVLWYLNEKTASDVIEKLSFQIKCSSSLKIRSISRSDKDKCVRDFWEQRIGGLEEIDSLQIYEVHLKFIKN